MVRARLWISRSRIGVNRAITDSVSFGCNLDFLCVVRAKRTSALRRTAEARDQVALGGGHSGVGVVHLQAHLEMRRLLSPEQIKKYDELRGYNSGGIEHKDHQHKH